MLITGGSTTPLHGVPEDWQLDFCVAERPPNVSIRFRLFLHLFSLLAF